MGSTNLQKLAYGTACLRAQLSNEWPGRVFLFAGLLFFFAVVDRIAVTVGNQVITETEILREIALTAFLNGEKPAFTPENKRKAADQLVEQKLVHKEMDMGHYPGANEDQAKELLAKTAKNVGGESEMQRQLTADGLTEDDLEKHLLWQLTLVHFIDLRFRPAIQVTPQDVQDYYRREVLPKQKPGQAVRLADVRDQILETLSAQRADQQLDEWLKHAKTTTRIDYRKEAFQ
jgi:peptidyl-prolyl cis-trans isomerase SurA